jgi:hypothetical protein
MTPWSEFSIGLSTFADYPDSDVAGLIPRLAVATGERIKCSAGKVFIQSAWTSIA